VRRTLVLVLALAVTGCGGAREHGAATLWVTRDRGAQVLFVGNVPAGLSAMQALSRARTVHTRYGGRFVQSINGLGGSLTKQNDWFYFVNGIEGDRSAAEVKLQQGDVEWWDYRHWTGATMSVPIVVGAYPQPFVAGKTSVLPVGVPRSLAASIAKQVHGVVASHQQVANFIVISARFPPEHVRISRFRDGYQLELGKAVAQRLAASVTALQFRYGVPR
jgi:Domain of unknown function (DUF4430)